LLGVPEKKNHRSPNALSAVLHEINTVIFYESCEQNANILNVKGDEKLSDH